MSRLIALIISCMIVITGASSAYGAEYTDVRPAHWAYEAVDAMSEQSIITGYPNGSFLPDNTITYGEFIKMALIAGTGEDAGNAASGHWAQNYYDKALEQGYFTEYDIERSMLGEKITREHMALIISSILGDVEIDNYEEVQKGITDITYKTKYEYDITKSYAYGILTGYTDRTFRPDKTLSRAESAAVIHRLVDESERIYPEDLTENSGDTNAGYQLVNTADYIDVSTVSNVKSTNTGDITEKAELYHDADEFNISLNRAYEEGWGSSFNHTMNGFIYLVKDGKVIEYCPTTPRYDSEGNFLYKYGSMSELDVTTADYFMVTRPKGSGDLVKLVPNPL